MLSRRTVAPGFSLIELLLAMVVAGVLAVVALPGFEQQVQRVRRADALVAAMQIQQAQERFHGSMARYGGLGQIGAASTSAQGHYRFEILRADAEGYELLATATGLQGRDAACRYLKLTAVGLDVRQSSGPDAGLANAGPQNRQCWGLR